LIENRDRQSHQSLSFKTYSKIWLIYLSSKDTGLTQKNDTNKNNFVANCFKAGRFLFHLLFPFSMPQFPMLETLSVFLVTVPQGSDEVAELVTVLIILLLVATAVALLTRWLRIPYVTGLVIAGLAIVEFLPKRVGLDPSLILNLFLPILIFEAAINTDISRLRSTVKPIALLAGLGVLIAAGITGTLIKAGLGFGWIPALFAGVILAITDTVSVIAVFKEVAVPARLITIVEGESLFNDGMALVLFSLIVAYLGGSLTPIGAIQQLAIVVLGGTLVGLGLGYLCVGLFRQSDDALTNILLTALPSKAITPIFSRAY
jgi:CPA1 family monovalent cation:H+ antiporter